MPDNQLSQELTVLLQEGGAVLSGYADLAILPAGIRHHLPVGIAFAMPITPTMVPSLLTGPTREYDAEYVRLNEALNVLGATVLDFLCRRGFRAIALGSTIPRLDFANLNTALPHKTVATRAGLGWVGKCALLVTEQYGSALRYNTILTDAPLLVGTPVESSHCGDCTACCDICPGGAPSGKPWHAGLPREEFFDALACALTAKRLSEALEISHTICGRCIAACPWTQQYLSRIDSSSFPES